ncbi:MAG: ATP-binding cassette domain-containing protein, partial [Clostridia bacterium]|nr:ATP-binding cassette domain-containing protein [Clostridia bacterium]
MIEITNLVKNYGTKFAVDDISFRVGKGEIVGFLGPNGAGKSTTMNILTGYLSSTSGEAKVGGIDILENPYEAKKLIGFLPEQPPVYPDMTVDEYLNFVYEIKHCKLNREKHL